MSSDRRVTNHSGRVHKSSGRVYNVDHNDRQFEHDNNVLEMKNVYWQRIQSDEITTFKQCEREFYTQTYGEHLRLCNERAEANRQHDRVKTIDDYLKSSAMAPEETLYYLGDKDNQVSTAQLDEFARDMVSWIEDTYPQIKVLDYAIHRDEDGADHIHLRKTYLAVDKEGNYTPSQGKALEQMGVQRPDISQPKNRYNNPKMTYTQSEREFIKSWCLEHDIELTTEPPRESGQQGRDMMLYQFEREIEQSTKLLMETREAIQEQLDLGVEIQSRAQAEQEKLDKLQRQNEHEAKKRELLGKTWTGKKKDSITIGKAQFETVMNYVHDVNNTMESIKREKQSVADREYNLESEKTNLALLRAAAEKDKARYEDLKQRQEEFIIGTANNLSRDKDDKIFDLEKDLHLEQYNNQQAKSLMSKVVVYHKSYEYKDTHYDVDITLDQVYELIKKNSSDSESNSDNANIRIDNNLINHEAKKLAEIQAFEQQQLIDRQIMQAQQLQRPKKLQRKQDHDWGLSL